MGVTLKVCNTLCHLNGVWPIKAITSYAAAFILSLGIIWNKRACWGMCGCLCLWVLKNLLFVYCVCVHVNPHVYYLQDISPSLNPWPPFFKKNNMCLRWVYMYTWCMLCTVYQWWCIKGCRLGWGGRPENENVNTGMSSPNTPPPPPPSPPRSRPPPSPPLWGWAS